MRRVNRYGKLVWENELFEDQRKGNCLCHTCAKFKPGETDNCPIANKFYKICVDSGCAFILTRCGSWKMSSNQRVAVVKK